MSRSTPAIPTIPARRSRAVFSSELTGSMAMQMGVVAGIIAGRREWAWKQKRKEHRPFGAVLPGSYPPPGTSPKRLRCCLERGSGDGCTRPGVQGADHTALVGEEA